MSRLLQDAERKMRQFMFDCSETMKGMANAAGNANYDQWAAVFKMDVSSSLGPLYNPIRGDGVV